MKVLDIDYAWEPIQASPGRVYRYPTPLSSHMRKAYSRTAIYRWAVYRNPSNTHPNAVYVGETENLVQRLGGYLHPGPSQQTNKRVKKFLDQEVAKESTVSFELLRFEDFHIITDEQAQCGPLVSPLRLSNPFIRKMMENFAIIVHDPVHCEILNGAMNPLERRREKAEKALQNSTFEERWASIKRRELRKDQA